MIRAEAKTCFLENANYENTFVHVTLVSDDSAPKGSNQPKHNIINQSNIYILVYIKSLLGKVSEAK